MVAKYNVVDTSGEVCPVPLIKARRGLEELNPGEILIVVGTHEPSIKDIVLAAKELGAEVVKLEAGGGKWRIVIRKKPLAQS